jgi:hypothetical protein
MFLFTFVLNMFGLIVAMFQLFCLWVTIYSLRKLLIIGKICDKKVA